MMGATQDTVSCSWKLWHADWSSQSDLLSHSFPTVVGTCTVRFFFFKFSCLVVSNNDHLLSHNHLNVIYVKPGTKELLNREQKTEFLLHLCPK